MRTKREIKANLGLALLSSAVTGLIFGIVQGNSDTQAVFIIMGWVGTVFINQNQKR